MVETQGRAGVYVSRPKGYRTFVPKPLPPDPPLQLDGKTLSLLSRADLALGRLDGASETLPNPDLFVYAYVRKEAVLSSQIEGTEASLMDLLEFESDSSRPGHPKDVAEVVNYVGAMNYGLEQLMKGRPITIPLIKEIHSRLLRGVRGSERNPGELRNTQNWIGAPGCSIRDATFTPPAVPDMKRAIAELEVFMGTDSDLPPLVRVGLVHAQFETIHPFLDGNGRMGRLLITFLLTGQGHLRRPLLYLSHFFKRYHQKYYDSLQSVRDGGDWEGWLTFFLQGIVNVSTDALETSRKILALRQRHYDQVLGSLRNRSGNGLKLLDSLSTRPVVTINMIKDVTGLAFPGAERLASRFVELGILREFTGKRRYRAFEYTDYLKILEA